MFKNTSPLQGSTISWFRWLVIVVGAVVLASCGSATTASTGTTPAPTTITQTPTAVPSSPTPTPTPAQATPAPAQGSAQTVMMNTDSNGSYGFSPTTLTIKVGTTITWKNVSPAPHSVTSDDGTAFDSGTVPIGGSYSFKFTTTGSFPYHCNYHPYMRATIVVV